MKVLHTLDSLNRGGTETLTLDVCRNASQCGIDLTFVATGGGSLEKEFETSNINYFRLHRKLPFDVRLVWKLRQIVKDTGVEIVHGHQPVEMIHLFEATRGLPNVRTVMTHHGGGLLLASWKNRVMSRLLSPRIDANITCSDALLPWLQKEVGLDTGGFHLVRNGVDQDRLNADQCRIRSELDIDGESRLIGMVANFLSNGTKDQMTVCRALAKVLSEFETVHFLFVGKVATGGEQYFDNCVRYCKENGIGDRVHFVGSRDDVPAILSDLDLFVLSTLHEGLPISLIEAMLKGVSVVATDIGPIREATDDGNCVMLFEPGNENELASKLRQLLQDNEMRLDYSERARDFALKNFSIKAHLRELKKLYSSLVQVTSV